LGQIIANCLEKKEAEYYVRHGTVEIVYAVGIAPVKLERIAHFTPKGCHLTIIPDSIEQVKVVAAQGQAHGLAMPALIELDCDGHLSGVSFDNL
jgi:D-serine deaminase-like pyridoxal phosphate-dependent protein